MTSFVRFRAMKTRWAFSEYITYLLLTLLFLSSWTDINGIFAELPQIVSTQPEGWRLGAYLGLVTNIGNIAPLALVLIKCLHRKHTFNPVPINYIVILIGMLSCFLLIFFWQRTSIVRNREYSTALLILALCLSFLDCTSSVSFADYVQKFRKEFTSTLFLGESLTSILPSLLAIAQGNGRLRCIPSANNTNQTEAVYEAARFSVSIYFLCLFLLLTISFVSFIILQWTPIARLTRQVLPRVGVQSPEESPDTVSNLVDPPKSVSVSSPPAALTKSSYLLLSLLCTYTSSILFGFLLSISSFVLMPYGQRIFYLGTILAPWTLTLIWALGMLKPLMSKRYLAVLIFLGSVTFSFELFVCFKSPCSPWANSTRGSILILTVWLSTYVLLGYPRLVIANYVRSYSSNGMFWYGVNVQLGALLGSIVAYLLIETFSLFRERLPCDEIRC